MWLFFGDKDTPTDSRPPIPWVPELDTDGAATLPTDMPCAAYMSFNIHSHHMDIPYLPNAMQLSVLDTSSCLHLHEQRHRGALLSLTRYLLTVAVHLEKRRTWVHPTCRKYGSKCPTPIGHNNLGWFPVAFTQRMCLTHTVHGLLHMHAPSQNAFWVDLPRINQRSGEASVGVWKTGRHVQDGRRSTARCTSRPTTGRSSRTCALRPLQPDHQIFPLRYTPAAARVVKLTHTHRV